jgi:hypothetical protein
MRKALFLTVLLSLAACGDVAEDDAKSTTSDNPVSTGNHGDSDESVVGGGGSVAAPIIASPTPSGSSMTSAGGSVGGAFVGGVAGGGGVVGGGGSAGGAIGALAPVDSALGSGGVAAPVTGLPSTELPVTPPVNVPAQQRALTAGVWDDNLNYERFHNFRSEVQQRRGSGILPFSNDEFEVARQLFNAPRIPKQKLDVALVIDTTGSMGDEITYLQNEFIALSRAIEAAYPNAAQRWALVLYRDKGDEYVTRTFDFRDDKEDFRQKLASQAAGGGGDFPEAPEAAFAALNTFSWRADADVARLAFWVADAPHHDEKAMELADGIRGAQDLSVHVYPIASSGIDEFTELTMRSSAQLTGGRYLFLTNDSGIGGAHKEPSIPCYFVTTLTSAITRMVDIELSGIYHEPETAQVLRTGGNPKDGACKSESGATLQVF